MLQLEVTSILIQLGGGKDKEDRNEEEDEEEKEREMSSIRSKLSKKKEKGML